VGVRMRGFRAVAGLVLLGVLVSGCADDVEPRALPSASSQAASPPVSPSATTSTAREIAERDALASYRGLMQAWVDAAKVANPDHPALRRYAQGEALKIFVTALFGNQLHKKVVLGEMGTDPKVVGAVPIDGPTSVKIADCLDDTRWLEHKKSGGLWDNKPGGRRHTTALVTKTKAGWKVTDIVMQEYGSC